MKKELQSTGNVWTGFWQTKKRKHMRNGNVFWKNIWFRLDFPARTSDSSDCNGYICCDNGTIIVCPAFDGDHDTLWFTMLLLVLLVPYIFHYYTLENETQKMYAQYDEIIKHTKKVNSGNLKKYKN